MMFGFYCIGGEDGVFRGVKEEIYEGKRVLKLGCIFLKVLGGLFCKLFKW